MITGGEACSAIEEEESLERLALRSKLHRGHMLGDALATPHSLATRWRCPLITQLKTRLQRPIRLGLDTSPQSLNRQLA